MKIHVSESKRVVLTTHFCGTIKGTIPASAIWMMFIVLCVFSISLDAAADFSIVQNQTAVPVIFDCDDAKVVEIAARAFARDVELVTDIKPAVSCSETDTVQRAIWVGTLEKSGLIRQLVQSGKLNPDRIQNQWESFQIQVVKNPAEGVDEVLVVAGSDDRGTAFGIFELSRRIGVSPWVYWADVLPQKQKQMSVQADLAVFGPPSVKYRGIFLNDEDWGLQPWAAENIDTDIKDIGPKTYARIFELLLRLKANYMWPAMHPCTKAFFYYKDNPQVARDYSIVIGSSHCEPMLRNNVDEWSNNFVEEYGKEPGPWRYDTNRDEIHRYWQDRVRQTTGSPVVYTVGMRGIHDSGVPGPRDMPGKVNLLNTVIKDQRAMLEDYWKQPAETVPQIFCPYKEVLQVYQNGLMLPDDVTLVWADDNHGYIRKLSTPAEQKRSGHSGVYYHLSYWGSPADYLWLSTTSPAMVSYEMSKAYAYGADRLWVFNVGDIKPAEMEMEFSLDLAWDVNAWPPERAHQYAAEWAERTFGAQFASAIGQMKSEYYRLAVTCRPEHSDKVTFTPSQRRQRLEDYAALAQQARDLEQTIPERLQDAYFQLILYPVLGCQRMAEKYLYAAEAGELPADDPRFSELSQRSAAAYEDIVALTDRYNHQIAGGKWNKMMSMNPRNLGVFKRLNIKPSSDSKGSEPAPQKDVRVFSAKDSLSCDDDLVLIPGLGVGGCGLTLRDIHAPSAAEEDAADQPAVVFAIPEDFQQCRVELRFAATHPIHEGRGLRIAVQCDDGPWQIRSLAHEATSRQWSRNVLQGYSSTDFELEGGDQLRCAFLDPGLILTQLQFDRCP